MARAAPPPAPQANNDGGVVVALVLLMAGLCAIFFGAVALYASADIVLTNQQKQKSVRARRLARLLSGWANIGNAVVHALLIVMLVTDTERYKVFCEMGLELRLFPAHAQKDSCSHPCANSPRRSGDACRTHRPAHSERASGSSDTQRRRDQCCPHMELVRRGGGQLHSYGLAQVHRCRHLHVALSCHLPVAWNLRF